MPVAQEQDFGLNAGDSEAKFWPLCRLLRSKILAFMPVAQEQDFGLNAGDSGAKFWPLCR
jgi:hypothetical protein